VNRLLRQLWQKFTGDEVNERLEGVSADLPYELQSKMFDQLATVSVAGAGLAVTLIGSLLRKAPPEVWFSVVFFGIAALTAVSGNIRLIEGVSSRRPILRRSKLDMSIAMALIGAASGVLSVSIYYDGDRSLTPADSAKSQR